jgi:hypothetical protein
MTCGNCGDDGSDAFFSHIGPGGTVDAPISPPGRALADTNFDVLVAMLVGMAYSTYRPAAARVGEEILRRHADTGATALQEAVGV